MAWQSASQQWAVVFSHITFRTRGQAGRAFDDLYVVVVSPTGLDLIKRDLAIGIDMNGNLTEVSGHMIQVTGSRSNIFWEEAPATCEGLRALSQTSLTNSGWLFPALP